MGRKKEKGNGEGTIYKSTKTGLYVGQYVTNGKRHSVYQKKNEKIGDFKKRFNKIILDIQNNTFIVDTDISLYTIIYNHIQTKYNTGIISPRTYVRDKDTLALLQKCCPFINKPVRKITTANVIAELPNMLQMTYTLKNNEKAVKIYSQEVIDKLYRLLDKGFKIAISDRIITYNPLDKESIKKPKSKKLKTDVEALSIEEQKTLVSILNKTEHKYKNIILLALYTGMRIGEILSLSRDNIDLEQKTIYVNSTLTKDENNNVILNNKTKTYAGKREVYINEKAENVLNNIFKDNMRNMYNLLFYDYSHNKFITPGEINSYLKRLNKNKAICNDIHTHMLRHTFATRCIEAGMSPKVLQKQLGHANIETTLNTYTSVFAKFKQDETEKYNIYMQSLGL